MIARAEDQNDELWGSVDYSIRGTVFSDHFAPVAFSTENSTVMGTPRLLLKGLGRHGSWTPDFQPLVALHSKDAQGNWQPVLVRSRICHPAGWIERGRANGFSFQQEVHFKNSQAAVVRWSIRPSDTDSPAPEVAFFGGLFPGESSIQASASSAGISLKLHKRFLHRYLRENAEFEIQYDLVASAAPDKVRFAAGSPLSSVAPVDVDSFCLADLEDAKCGTWWLELSDLQRTESDWEASIEIRWGSRETEGIPEVSTLAEACRNWKERLENSPGYLSLSSFWRARAANAYSVIVGNAIRSPGYGNFSEELALTAAPTGALAGAFYWDHVIGSIPLAAWDPELQASAIRCFMQHTTGGRMTPGVLLAYPQYGNANVLDGFAPIGSWGVEKARLCAKSDIDLKSLYPHLVRAHEGWLINCDRDGDGIPEWRNTGNPGDDSPLYDRYRPTDSNTCFELPPFVSVNLCTYLLMDARLLQRFAAELGNQDDETRWSQRVELYESVLMKRLWDPDALFFWDRTPDNLPVHVRTFFGLLPLWAGVPLSKEDACKAIERHLLDPGAFFGDIPFPSVAYDEPTYDPVGYWRGRSWPHVYFWNTEILWKYGYEKEALRARSKYLELSTCWRSPAENFPTQPHKLDAPVMQNYVWGAGTLLMFLYGWDSNPVL